MMDEVLLEDFVLFLDSGDFEGDVVHRFFS